MLPNGFEEMVREVIGDGEWDAFVDALEAEPSVSVRINSQQAINPSAFGTSPKTGEEYVGNAQQTVVKWCEWGRYLAERPKFTYDPLFHAGRYYVQEASSMFVWQALKQYVAKDAVMLDMCAAPGGKSTLIAQYLGREGFLVSNEYVPQRAHVLVENMTKWGARNVVVTNNAPRHFEKLKMKFDAILVDAPCSGEGMFRKDERAREEWSLANVEMCVERGREILESAWEVLKPGGVLIYSTCTFNRRENEEQVQWLIDEMGAEYLPIEIGEDWMITETERGYRFLPHKTRGEGLFLAAVRKECTMHNAQCTMHNAQCTIHNEKKAKDRKEKKHKKENNSQLSTFNFQLFIANGSKTVGSTFNLLEGDWDLVVCDSLVYAVEKKHAEIVAECRKVLNVMLFGVPMFEIKGKDLIPQTALAMSDVLKHGVYPEVDLTYDEAIAYLRKEAIVLDSDVSRGFVLVTYKGVPLGWVKNIGNRSNNLYPEYWRIRN